jgi:predicted transcriptional regulator
VKRGETQRETYIWDIEAGCRNMREAPSDTIRLTPELDEQVAKIAEALNRPKSWIIEQAVKDFVALQEWHLATIEEGIRDADAGRVAPHDDVTAWVRSWGKPDELPTPECRK